MTSSEGGGGMGKTRCPEVFRGWLSDIITAGPSLVVFSSVPFPVAFPFFISRLSFLSLFPFRVEDFPFSPLSYFVSRHCPFQFPRDCGANAARYRINFLSRGCRDFTLLERRHWGGSRLQSETSAATWGLMPGG